MLHPGLWSVSDAVDRAWRSDSGCPCQRGDGDCVRSMAAEAAPGNIGHWARLSNINKATMQRALTTETASGRQRSSQSSSLQQRQQTVTSGVDLVTEPPLSEHDFHTALCTYNNGSLASHGGVTLIQQLPSGQLDIFMISCQ